MGIQIHQNLQKRETEANEQSYNKVLINIILHWNTLILETNREKS